MLSTTRNDEEGGLQRRATRRKEDVELHLGVFPETTKCQPLFAVMCAKRSRERPYLMSLAYMAMSLTLMRSRPITNRRTKRVRSVMISTCRPRHPRGSSVSAGPRLTSSSDPA